MWQPLSQEKLVDMIDNAEWMMESPVRAFWDRIKITPEKWQLPSMGDEGGGFWVVALVGQECLYYNDIEGGFNRSPYDKSGQITNYFCNQSDLLAFMKSYHQDFIADISVGR